MNKTDIVRKHIAKLNRDFVVADLPDKHHSTYRALNWLRETGEIVSLGKTLSGGRPVTTYRIVKLKCEGIERAQAREAARVANPWESVYPEFFVPPRFVERGKIVHSLPVW